MPLVIVGAGILALFLVIVSILLLRRAEEDPLSARIDQYAAREEPVSIEEIELSMPITDRIIVPILRRLGEIVTRLTPQSMLDDTSHRLELAGSPGNISAAEFWVIRGLTTIALGILFFFFLGRFGQDPGRRVLFSVVVAAFGFYLPSLYLSASIRRRQEAIIKKFPDALDLMSICVDAGLPFDGAMARVHEKWDDPLATEFGRVIYEVQLGKSRRQALRDMANRMEVNDISSFVAAILQAEHLGVSIGKVLRIQSEQMRIRRRQRAEEKAHQAPVKMLFPLVFLIFPSMFIVLLGPAVFQVLRTEALRQVAG
ncbi:MAG: type II secretion system F family protein [Chloroflexota bacterium]|jgi:tight adherence protein C